MTYTPIVIGSLAWGGPVNAALGSQDARISSLESRSGTVAALGFKAQPFAPEMASMSETLASGTIIMTQVNLPVAGTLSTLTAGIFTAGSGLTAGQNFGGLYSTAGSRLAVTADQSAAWATNGEKNMAFTAPYAAAAGTYYLALLSVGTTPITPFRAIGAAASANMINHGLTPATARYTTGPTAQTSLPTAITMSARTLSGNAFWMAVS